MRLQELFEKSDISEATPINFKGRTFLPISGDLAGEGVQARVYHTGQGMVTKIAAFERMEDPTITFLKLVLENQDNPFFPRIYHARIYKDKTGERDHMLLIIQMEKLTSLLSPKIRDAAAALFKQLGIELTKKQQDNLDVLTNPKMVANRHVSMLASNIDDIYFDVDDRTLDKNLQKSKNPKFNEAVKLLYPYVEFGMSDLHANNWMVRLTPHGPQLVIIDPFTPESFRNEEPEMEDRMGVDEFDKLTGFA
jgi:hypothetical protein